MIDWLTLRIGLGAVGPEIHARVMAHMGRVMAEDAQGNLKWMKHVLDVDSLRSDTPGLCWQVSGSMDDGLMLVIGASPASIEHGCNVFGSSEIEYCAGVIVRHAAKVLGVLLPAPRAWSVRRVDVTHNYALGSSQEVKQALRYLMGCDGSRQKAQGVAGDSVYWGAGSDLIGGKAYHKGPQLLRAWRKNKADVSEEQIGLADRLLRLELSLKGRWFRRFYEAGRQWWQLTVEALDAEHAGYFGKFIGRVEVADMGQLLEELKKVCETEGRALAAHRTWALIKTVGRDQAKDSMPKATWCRHTAYLRKAGISDADLCAGQVVPFRRHVLEITNPVSSWDELRRAA